MDVSLLRAHVQPFAGDRKMQTCYSEKINTLLSFKIESQAVVERDTFSTIIIIHNNHSLPGPFVPPSVSVVAAMFLYSAISCRLCRRVPSVTIIGLRRHQQGRYECRSLMGRGLAVRTYMYNNQTHFLQFMFTVIQNNRCISGRAVNCNNIFSIEHQH